MMHRVAVLSLASFTLLSTAFAAAVSVNGTCEFGNCSTPDTLSSGSLSESFNFIYTLGNGDQFQVQGTYAAQICGTDCSSLNGTEFSVTYLGNASQTASGADVLTIDLLQNVKIGPVSEAFGDSVYGGFSGLFASTGSSATFQSIIAGSPLPVMGHFTRQPRSSLNSLTSTFP